MWRRDSRRSDRSDPWWDVAASTQIFTADRDIVVGMVRAIEWEAAGGVLDGVLTARRHPTGWFLRAVRRDDLRDDELTYFREMVTVRSYLLLRHGPVTPLWRPVPGSPESRSAVPSLAAEVAGIAGDLGA